MALIINDTEIATSAEVVDWEEHGMVFSGISPDGLLVEMIELTDHPYFIATQYHPEFQSRPNRAHPLFRDFVTAAINKTEKKRVDEKTDKVSADKSQQ